MILVLSYDAYEQGTDPVTSWLLHKKANFLKISMGDLLGTKLRYTIDIDTQSIMIDGINYRDKINVIWHRRFMGELGNFLTFDSVHATNLRSEIRKEVDVFANYLSTILKDKKWLTSFKNININKIEALNIAQSCGLSIPQSRILNNREAVYAFESEAIDGIITKTISGSRGHYLHEGDTYVMLTTDMTPEHLDILPDFFLPTLFQAKIKADFEIRVFYLDGQFFSTAILTPKSARSVDRKMDNDEASTHFVPYQLPQKLMNQLNDFMERIGLNTGSIDLMKCSDESFVFLEVNPVGQYSAESEKCNYKIEKAIAEWLIKNDK
jgi:ATP-GRASP peptide maturase of grasp-with-spasm system